MPGSRFGRIWVASVAFVVVLVLVLVFIFQNLNKARVHFMAWSGSPPLGLALLLAVVSGAIVVLLIGSIRIMQLRKTVRHGGSGPTPRHVNQAGSDVDVIGGSSPVSADE